MSVKEDQKATIEEIVDSDDEMPVSITTTNGERDKRVNREG